MKCVKATVLVPGPLQGLSVLDESGLEEVLIHRGDGGCRKMLSSQGIVLGATVSDHRARTPCWAWVQTG